MKKLFIASVSLAALFASSAYAEQYGDQIVVSATKSKKKIKNLGSSITVINKKEIEAKKPVQVLDLLKDVTGLNYNSTGGIGQTTSVYIRGAANDKTQVIYDGVKLSDAASPDAGFNFGNFIADDLERVEVLKGPQSALYGSAAIGGVINITSATPKEGLSGLVNLESGSKDTYLQRYGIAYKNGNFTGKLNLHSYQTQGISAAALGTERDGYRNNGVSGSANYAFDNNNNFDVRADYTKSNADYDSSIFKDTSDKVDTKSNMLYAGWNNVALNGRLHQTISAQNYNSYRDYSAGYDYNGRIYSFAYQGNLKVSDQFSLVGGASRDENKANYSEYIGDSIHNAKNHMNSFFGEAQIQPIKKLNITAGLREDEHSAYGNHLSARGTIAYKLLPTTIVRANYGEGFKAPSLYQLYNKFAGNPSLKSETSHGYEFGVNQQFGDNLNVDLAYFNNKENNPIIYDDATYIYENVASVQTHGIELAAKGKVNNVLLNGGYTYLNAKDETTGNQLYRRPKNTAFASMGYEWPNKVTTYLDWNYIGERSDLYYAKDYSKVNTNLKSVSLFGLRASYDLDDKTQIYARVQNIGDKKYQEVYGYNTLGRTATIGLKVKY